MVTLLFGKNILGRIGIFGLTFCTLVIFLDSTTEVMLLVVVGFVLLSQLLKCSFNILSFLSRFLDRSSSSSVLVSSNRSKFSVLSWLMSFVVIFIV